jgi:fumarate hydratase subunit alpha
MREVNVSLVRDAVAKLLIDSSCIIPDDLLAMYKDALKNEVSPLGRHALEQIIENAEIARRESIPSCQDTGLAVVFIDVGQEVHLVGGSLEKAIQDGVKKGYIEGYLRKSAVSDALFDRKNSGDNSPGIVHMRIVDGDKIRLRCAPKGFGSENKAKLKMLMPADGVEGFKQFVFESVREAGADPCPPVVVGVGVGGTFEKCALMAKIASMRDVSTTHPDPRYAALETELRDMLNKTGVGPQGFGGRYTCLKVNIEEYPTHMGGLPVAVNINCHAARHAEATI